MIKVQVHSTKYLPWVEGDDEREIHSRDEQTINCETFRELLDLVQYCEPPINGSAADFWFTETQANDGTREFYEQGIEEEKTFHLADNTKVKYWDKARTWLLNK